MLWLVKLNLSFLVFSIEYSARLELLPASMNDPSPLFMVIPKLAFQLFSIAEVLALTRDSLEW